MTIDYTITRHGRNATLTVVAEGETLATYTIPTKAVRQIVDRLLDEAETAETFEELTNEMDLVIAYL